MKDERDRVDPFATREMSTGAAFHGEDATPKSPCTGSRSGSGRLEVRCPMCHVPTEVAVDTSLTDLTCSACGSHFSLVDQSKATRMAPSLSQLGRFELIERLGFGAFGSVWKARDKELDRTVAIKIPRAGDMTGAEQEQFFREARAAAQLRHPNIVSVHEVGREGESIYIVSDFVRGVTLADWLTGQQLTNREAIELCCKIADALHHAHEQGVVHRDLKPSNILIDGEGDPHLMDFGLARREAGEVTVTMDGQVLGTPAYMSPEQAEGESHTADRRSDVYSLGVILFQLLTGEMPFRGNARMLMHQVIHDEPPSPRKFNSNVSRDLETITLKCLEKSPDNRYQTARELADELRRVLGGAPINARPIGRVERGWRWIKRNPRVAVLTASIAILLIAVAVLSVVGFTISKRQQIIAEETAKREGQLRSQAEENLLLAEKAVDSYLTRVADDDRLKQSDFNKLRIELLETAVPFYEQFATQKPNDPQSEANQANAYARLASIHGRTGQQEKSFAEYDRAIAVETKLAAQFPQVAVYRRDLADHHLDLGWNFHVVGKFAQAQQHYEAALNIFSALLKLMPLDAGLRHSLATAHIKYGFLLTGTDRVRAAKDYETAIQLCDSLVHDAPEITEYQSSLAHALFRLGYMHLEQGEAVECRELLGKAITIQRRLVKKNQKNADDRARLAESVAYQGGALYQLREYAGASRQYEEGIEIASAVASDFPSVREYRVILGGIVRTYFKNLFEFYPSTATPEDCRRTLALLDKVSSIDLSPAVLLFDRAWLHERMAASYQSHNDQAAAGKHQAESKKLFDELIALAKNDPAQQIQIVSLLNEWAWMLATSADDERRDGKRAVELATTASQILQYNRPRVLNTLAAAYAESGDFDSAVKWSEKARELIGDKGDARLRDDTKAAIATYKSKKPMRRKAT